MNKLVNFIPRTTFPEYRVNLSDFKGHHVKALNQMTKLAPQLDLIFELRDARAPLASRNVLLDRPLRNCKKVILYSKKDLSRIDVKLLRKWHGKEPFMFVDCRSKRDSRLLLEIAKEKFYEMNPSPPLGLRTMVVGMPNVGKSTLVNTLRKVGLDKLNNVAKTGGQPGVTRATSSIIKISEEPEILLYDTPGVFLPKVDSTKTMILLSLIGAVKPNVVDPIIQADYLLYLINLQNWKLYSKYLNHPTNDIMELLEAMSKRLKKYHKKTGEFDDVGTAIHFVDNFKQGRVAGLSFELEMVLKNEQFDFDKAKEDEVKRIDEMDIALNRNIKKPMTYKESIAKNANQLFKPKLE